VSCKSWFDFDQSVSGQNKLLRVKCRAIEAKLLAEIDEDLEIIRPGWTSG
jgi:hypothetical protein